jgi:hypothetical protein
VTHNAGQPRSAGGSLNDRERRPHVPTCAVTGLVAGHPDACGDCDPCGGAHLVPEAVQRLLAETNEWAERYSRAMEDRADLRACLLNIQSLAEKGFPIDSGKLATRCRRSLDNSTKRVAKSLTGRCHQKPGP